MMAHDKTILITGASSGIGLAAAKAFAQSGWRVAATMRKADQTLFNDVANVTVLPLDVTDPQSISAAMRKAVKEFGRLDVVVNNAGYGLEGVFEAMTDQDIQKQYDTNVFGLMRVTRAAVQQMRKQGGGTIIQVASFGGRMSFPLFSVYNSTKWAVEGFTEGLSYELAQFNIRLKIVEPGIIKTNFYDAGRQFMVPKNDATYNDFVDRVSRVSQDAGHSGEAPEKVAQAIVRAASDGSQRLRYAVGKPAPTLLLLRRLLPDRFFMGGLRRIYRI